VYACSNRLQHRAYACSNRLQHTDFLNPLLSGFLPNCFSALLAKTHEADLREYHKKQKTHLKRTKNNRKQKNVC